MLSTLVLASLLCGGYTPTNEVVCTGETPVSINLEAFHSSLFQSYYRICGSDASAPEPDGESLTCVDDDHPLGAYDSTTVWNVMACNWDADPGPNDIPFNFYANGRRYGTDGTLPLVDDIQIELEFDGSVAIHNLNGPLPMLVFRSRDPQAARGLTTAFYGMAGEFLTSGQGCSFVDDDQDHSGLWFYVVE